MLAKEFHSFSQRLLGIGLLALLYWGLAQLGLQLAIPPGYATAFWPSSGIALAALLWAGRGLVPGVFLGSLAVNLLVSQAGPGLDARSVAMALGMALGASLQALLGHSLVIRVLGARALHLRAAGDFFRLILFGGPIACSVAATLATGLLYWRGLLAQDELLANAFTWWIGDSLGVLVFAPALLLLLQPADRVNHKHKLLAIVPMIGLFGLIASGYFHLRSQVVKGILQDLDHRAAQSQALIESEVLRVQNIVDSGRALFVASNSVEREEFGRFGQLVMDKTPALLSLAWALEIPGEQRDELQARARREGYANFDIWEFNGNNPSSRIQTDIYCPLFFVYPPNRKSLLGFDLFTLGDARHAITNAGHSGFLVAAPMELPDIPGDNHWLLMRPVGANPQQGLLIALVDLKALFTGAGELLVDKAIGLRVTDVLSKSVIYQSTDFDTQATYTARRPFSLGLRPLALDFAYRNKSSAQVMRNSLWPLLCGGFLFAGLLAVFVMNATTSTQLLSEKVRERTQDLEDERQYLAAIIENLPLTVVVKEPNELRVTHMNRVGEEITGLSKDDYLGKTDFDLLPVERAKAFTMSDRAVMHSGLPVDLGESLFSFRTGMAWIHLRKIPVKDAQGNNRLLLILAENVTPQREQRIALNTVIESLPLGLLILAENGDIRYANPHALELFAMPSQGVNLSELIPADLRAHHQDLVARFFAAPGVRGMATGRELQAQTLDGQGFDAEIALAPIRWYGEKCALALVSNITQKRQTQQQLSLLDTHMRLILASLAEGVCGLDALGRITFINAAACAMFGLPEDSLLGQNIDSLLQDPTPCPLYSAYQQGHIQQGKRLVPTESASPHWVSFTATPLFDSQGKVTGAVLVLNRDGNSDLPV